MATIGVKLELSSAEFRNGMKQATSEVKLFDTQLKGLSKNLTENTNAFQKHLQKTEALKGKLEALKTEQSLLTAKLQESKEKFGENSAQANDYATKLEKCNQQIVETEKALKSQNGTWGAVGAQIAEVGKKVKEVGDKMQEVGKTLTTHVTVPLAAVGATSVKAFADWESAFTGVMKTVDETATTTYADLQESIKKMATETASSKEEIAGVAEVAGQLGIKADDIEKFTKTMVMLGDSTNLSADEAATSLARVINITGESTDNIDRLGSSVVALGNNFATDEASIVEMSNRLASAGTIAGMSTQDILALSTAMSSVGIQAEAGGTAMTQTLTGISKAVSDGGAKLDQLAETAGMTAEQFATTWQSSPIDALQAFIGGLSQMNEQELDTYSLLDELGMSGVRQSNMLQSLALASDTLTNAVQVSNQAYEENTALVDEASKRYETFDAKMSQTKEKIGNVAIEIGERLLPYIDKALAVLDKLIAAWDNLSPEMQDTIVKIGLIVAAIGPMLMIIGKLTSTVGQIMMFAPQIMSAIGGIATMITGTVIPTLASLAVAAGTAMLPFLPFIAIAAAVVAAGVLIYKNWDTIKEKAGQLKDWLGEKFSNIKEGISNKWNELKENTSQAWSLIKGKIEEHGGGIQGVIGTCMEAYKNLWDQGCNFLNEVTNGKFGEMASKVSEKMGEIKDKVSNAMASAKASVEEHGGGIKGAIGAYSEWYASKWKSAFDSINQATGGKLGDALSTVKEKLGNIKDAFLGIIEDAKNWGKDLVDNFTSGIKNSMASAGEAAKSVAGTVSSYLHFTTPDKGPLKDADTYGPDFMKLYAKGIEDYSYLVKNAVSDVAMDMTSLGTLDPESIYGAVRQGSEDANVSIYIGERELGRALRGMGVQLA